MSTEVPFKDLVKRYLDNGISRRNFLTTLTGIGLGATAADSIARDFEPFVVRRDDPEPLPEWARSVRATGGKLLVEQLKAAGHRFLFLNPSSREAPVYDALVDEPDLHIIKAVHEGALVAMADGYAKATGEAPFVMISRPGLPNAMSMMFNSWRDYTPMVVLVDDVGEAMLTQDGFEAMDHMPSMTQTMTKWHWSIQSAGAIPEVARRAHKFAATKPCGPVFLAAPGNYLAEEADAAIVDQEKFLVPMQLRPAPDDIRKAAQLLLAAENPLILAGDEVRYCHAQPELLELAELLGIPVAKEWTASWSKTFPNRHPLYVGNYQVPSRYPGKIDVMLNLGSRMPLAGSKWRIEPQVRLIQVRVDATNLARVYPTELPIVADLKLALRDLLEEIRRKAAAGRLRRISAERLERARKHKSERDSAYEKIARNRWNNDPISGERVIGELEQALDRNTVIVSDNDTYMWPIDNYLTYGPDDKDYYFNTGFALGWGLPAAFGVKLALPDRPVVCLVSDGSLLFSGPQPLWSYSRYRAPVMILVMNNRSYNNERNRIMQYRGRSYDTGRDMVCYLGDPDVDYVKLAAGFGVDGETVDKPDRIRAAIHRGMQAMADGRAYLLDVHVERTGSLANSSWYPGYRIASS